MQSLTLEDVLMVSVFNDLLGFFGISEAPLNLGELIPWLVCVMVAVCLVLYVLGFISQIMRGFNK